MSQNIIINVIFSNINLSELVEYTTSHNLLILNNETIGFYYKKIVNDIIICTK